MTLTPGMEIPYYAGPGGTAGQELGEAGQTGTDTTFGELSSADGVRPESGYVDTVTGETLCLPGADGVDGGDGGDGGSGGSKGGDGGNAAEWTGGQGHDGQSGTLVFPNGGSQGSYSYGGGGGGGAAYGVNGNAASGSNAYDCADGVTALPHPANPEGSYGSGGAGGNGGGGGGGSGQLKLTLNDDSESGTWTPTGGAAGLASVARDGSPGCIILYFRTIRRADSGAVATSDSKWLLDKFGRRIIV